MNVRWISILALSGLVSVAGTGCEILSTDSDQAGEETEQNEQEAEQQSEEETEGKEEGEEELRRDEEPDDEEEERAAEGEENEAEFDQEDYVKASAELACVDMKLSESETIDLDEVEKEILGKYGFDEETFDAAGDEFDGTGEVDSAVEERLEECDEAQAKTYAGIADEGGDDSEEQKQEERPDPKPKSTGSFNAEFSKKAGFEKGIVQLSISDDFELRGSFRGSRSGSGFRVPFDGNVTKTNQLKAHGRDSGNEVTVTGEVGSDAVSLELSGKVVDERFQVTATAR